MAWHGIAVSALACGPEDLGSNPTKVCVSNYKFANLQINIVPNYLKLNFDGDNAV